MKEFYTLFLGLFIMGIAQAKNFSVKSNPANSPSLVLVVPTFNPVSPICAGDFLAPLPATSQNGITGSWSPVIDNLNTTTYTFTPNPGQDATQASITIIVYAIPTTVVFCDSSNMPSYMTFDWAAIVNAGFYEFSYSIDGGPQVTGSTFISNYSVFGVQSNQSITFTLTNLTGRPCFIPLTATCGTLINTDFEATAFNHFPNPIIDILNLSYKDPINSIEVFNVIGQRVFSATYNSNLIQLPFSEFKAGIYVVKIKINTITKIIKVVKN